jgi:hypothetical protein
MDAAKRYLPASDSRDQKIAAALSRLAQEGDPMTRRTITQAPSGRVSRW